MSKIYPFKFLDAYGKEDTHLFFGRDEEINTMYQMVFQTNILLVYGASGTGKTSLIQCGLASKFQPHDWLSLFVRRGNNLNTSLEKVLSDAGGNKENGQDEEIDFSNLMDDEHDAVFKKTPLSPLAKSFKAIYLNYFRPIYLIFDQFEELFILGTRHEQELFIRTVKEIMQLDQPVKMIFSIREEYLGHLFEFEKQVPQLLRKKLRVEPMNLDKVSQVLSGITKFKGSNISTKAGEEGKVTESIFSKIKGKEKSLTIQLPYLQVFLDKLYLETTHDETRQADAVFEMETLNKMGDIGDVLRNFLENQVKAIGAKLNTASKPVYADDIWKILSPFATLEGTKEPTAMNTLLERLPGTDPELITDTVNAFVNSRILRVSEDGAIYELAHDSLAGKIAGKRSDEEIALLEVKRLVKSQAGMKADARELFSEKQLNFIDPYLDKLVISEEEKALLEASRKEIKIRRQKKKNLVRLIFASMIISILSLSYLAIWAFDAKSTAIKEKKDALSHLLSGQAHVLQYRYGDVTRGFRFAQYALQKEPGNLDAQRALYTALFQANDDQANYFYKFVLNHWTFVHTAVLSADGKKLLTATDDSLGVWDVTSGKRILVIKDSSGLFNSAVFSPDGSKIATASRNRNVTIWDAVTGGKKAVHTGHTKSVNSVSFSPDGKMIVSASADGTAKIWDSSGNATTLNMGLVNVFSAVFSMDGTRVMTRSSDSSLKIWDITGATTPLQLIGHAGSVLSASFSPDGKYIATGSDDFTAKIWDAVTGKTLRTLRPQDYYVNSVVFSPDSKSVITISNKQATIWNVTTGIKITTLSGHISPVNSASFSADGSKVITASVDHTARIWNARNGKKIASLNGHTAAVSNAFFLPDSNRVLTVANDYTEKIWDASAGKKFHKLLGTAKADHYATFRPIDRPVFSPDSKLVLTVPYDSTVRIMDVATGSTQVLLTGHTGIVRTAVFSPDGKTVLTASFDRTARIWDAVTGKELKVLEGHMDSVFAALFSPDGQLVVTRSSDNSVRIWDVATGTELAKINSNGRLTSVSFSPDSKKVVIASLDNTAKIWDIATARVLQVFSGHTSDVFSAVFSPDGKWILTASGDYTAKIWDVSTGKELRTLKGHFGAVSCAAFSPDGKLVVTASRDNTIQIWDAFTGKDSTECSGHTGQVHTAFFSPDGKKIISASGDNTARLWDVATGKELATLPGNTGYAYCASLSPDGKWVLSISDDHTSKLWNISIPDIINAMDKEIGDIYPWEKEKYHIANGDNSEVH